MQCRVHAVAAHGVIGRWVSVQGFAYAVLQPPCLRSTLQSERERSSSRCRCLDTTPSQEPRNMSGPRPPGFLHARITRQVRIRARLGPVTPAPRSSLHPYLPRSRGPEPHTLGAQVPVFRDSHHELGTCSLHPREAHPLVELGLMGSLCSKTKACVPDEILTLKVDDLSVAAVHAHVGPAPASSG